MAYQNVDALVISNLRITASTRMQATLSDGRQVIVCPPYSGTGFTIARYRQIGSGISHGPTLNPGGEVSVIGITVDADDNLHVAYQEGGTLLRGGTLRYAKYEETSPDNWVVTTQQTIASLHASAALGNLDIDVLDSGVVVVAVNFVQYGGNPPYNSWFYVYTRRTAGTWGLSYQEQLGSFPSGLVLNIGNVTATEACTIARDAAGSASGYQFIAWAAVGADGSYSCKIARVTLDTGVIEVDSNYANPFQNFSGTQIPDTAAMLFAVGPDQWVLLATTGQVDPTVHAIKFGRVTGTIAQLASAAGIHAYAFNPSLYWQVDVMPTFAWLDGSQKGVVFTVRKLHPAGVYYQVVDLANNTFTWGAPQLFRTSNATIYNLKSGSQRNFGFDTEVSQESLAPGIVVGWMDGSTPRAWHWRKKSPAMPVSTQPTNGSTVSTDVPVLRSTTNIPPLVSTPAMGVRERAQWQIASDSGFTTNVRLFTDPDLSAVSAPSANSPVNVIFVEQLTNVLQLAQGTWYIRSRLVDEMGQPSEWTSANSFTVSHPPAAAPASPSAGQYLQYTDGNFLFSYIFSDPSPVDYLTAHEIQVQRNDTQAVVATSGKIAATQPQKSLFLPNSLVDIDLRWRVRPYDSDDVAGNWSNWTLFRIGNIPTVTITSPEADEVVDNPAPTVTWNTSVGGGRTITQYRVVYARASDQAILHDTGFLTGNPGTYTPPSAVLANDLDTVIAVAVQDNTGMLGFDTVSIDVDYTAPATPAAPTVDDTLYADDGYLKITWDDAVVDEDFYSWRLYRRLVGGTWELYAEFTTNQANYEYHDWLAGSGVHYEYSLSQVATRFGVLIEGEQSDAVEVVGVSQDYWFIHPNDSELNFKLHHVTADSYTDEYEETTILLKNKGRKKEYGTHYGVTGSLTAHVRNWGGDSARLKRLELELLKATQNYIFLRTPFGDIWRAALSNIGVSRVPGVGLQEFVDLTIPYEEVV